MAAGADGSPESGTVDPTVQLLHDQLQDLQDILPSGHIDLADLQRLTTLPTIKPQQQSASSTLFNSIAQSLAKKLAEVEGTSSHGHKKAVDIQALALSRGYPYPLTPTDPGKAIDLLSFLAAEVQASRVLAHRNHQGLSSSSSSPPTTDHTTRLLIKLALALQVLPPGDSASMGDPRALLGLIEAEVGRVLKEDVPQGYLTLADEKAIKGVELNDSQRRVLEEINQAMREDFTLRRKMLLKRADVTVQSFLWAEKAHGVESEIVSAIHAKRESMGECPRELTVNQALDAPASLLYQQAGKITAERKDGKALVKTIIIGTVPDRGGRANEMRPSKAEMNPYSSGRGGGRGYQGGGRGRGRGGNHNQQHRGGGGGGGGRGGGGGGGVGGGGGGGGRGGGGGGGRGGGKGWHGR